MFLGVPAVLAILLALTPKARTVTGGIIKGISLALLIVAPLVGEGYLCILFASPLFYLVGTLVGIAVDTFKRNRGTTVSCIALALLPLCMEGVAPRLTWSRNQSVSVTRVISAPADAVEASLSQSPRLGTALPRFLRIGFPRPLEAHGEGLRPGAMRTIHFAGAEGDPPGDLVMRIAERRPGYARFETVSDDSKLTQWLRWDDRTVAQAAMDKDPVEKRSAGTRHDKRNHPPLDRCDRPLWFILFEHRSSSRQKSVGDQVRVTQKRKHLRPNWLEHR
jgi:hypothetical protein